MLLRSASAPILSSLVPEGDLDCSLFNNPFAAPRPLFHGNGSSKPMLSMRRAAHSETDLQRLVHSLAEAEGQIHAAEKQHRHAFPKLSIIPEKEQFSASVPEVNREYLEKEGFFIINREPYSSESGKRSPKRRALRASLPTSPSAPYEHGAPLVKEGERLNPLFMGSRISVSSNTEDLIRTADADDRGCDGGRGGSVGGCEWSSSPQGDSNNTDLYYQRLLHSDPHNPLFLSNYAQFLSEAKHDYRKSEEYYERAILACPDDGEVLSRYAKHVWDVHKDSGRANSYFDQAVKAAPEDCYVLASYASFLWQSEEDEEEDTRQTTFPSLHGTSAAPSPVMASA